MKKILSLFLVGSGVALRYGAKQLNKIKIKTSDIAESKKVDKLFDIDVKPYMDNQEIKRLQKIGVIVNPKDYSVSYSKETFEKLGGEISVDYKMHVSYRIKKKVIEKAGDFLEIVGLLLALTK